MDGPMDGPMNGPTDRRTDRQTDTQLKIATRIRGNTNTGALTSKDSQRDTRNRLLFPVEEASFGG